MARPELDEMSEMHISVARRDQMSGDENEMVKTEGETRVEQTRWQRTEKKASKEELEARNENANKAQRDREGLHVGCWARDENEDGE